jgi:hypothetical protein
MVPEAYGPVITILDVHRSFRTADKHGILLWESPMTPLEALAWLSDLKKESEE